MLSTKRYDEHSSNFYLSLPLPTSPDPEHEGTQKEHILLFPVLCCLEQDLIGSFLFPLSLNPNSQSVATPCMWVPGVNFHRVLNYWNKQSIHELSTHWNNLGSTYNHFILA